MIKLTFYNNDVITSDTIDSTAALHDVRPHYMQAT